MVLGVTGGIAAYKACNLASRLRQDGAHVTVIMTRSAEEFVTPLTFQALTGRKAITRQFDAAEEWDTQHISLAKKADIVIVAPATANLLGKHASGVADDFLTTFLLAVRAPILIAPAMNSNMYFHPSVQKNIEILRGRGIHIIEPGEGHLACGDVGPGRMAEPETILAEAERVLARQKDLAGVRVLVTAGPTREHIDRVRYISNPSSGKMGIALAEEARNRGAQVTLVLGPTHLPVPSNLQVIRVTSADEMAQRVFEREHETDIIIGAAAVSDFKPAKKVTEKVKKEHAETSLELERTTDILQTVGERKGNLFLVGFGAETEEFEANARKKLSEKNLDLIVVNDVSGTATGFASEQNSGIILDRDGNVREIPLLSKREMAAVIWDHIISLRSKLRQPVA